MPRVPLSWLLGGLLESDARDYLGWKDHGQLVFLWNHDIPPQEDEEEKEVKVEEDREEEYKADE
jgi:hypothetical protein